MAERDRFFDNRSLTNFGTVSGGCGLEHDAVGISALHEPAFGTDERIFDESAPAGSDFSVSANKCFRSAQDRSGIKGCTGHDSVGVYLFEYDSHGTWNDNAFLDELVNHK